MAKIRVMSPTYTLRNELLPKLGFPSYKDYLNSCLWAEIRDAILDRDNHLCRLCQAAARIVHHIDYSEATLRGDSLDELVSLCHGCHEKVEFTEDGDKRTLLGAMVAYRKICKKPVQVADDRKICTKCKKNSAPKNRKVCAKCVRKSKGRLCRCSHCGKNWSKKNSNLCRPCTRSAS